jgi:outer membrane biosynthesis protein TonB
MNRLITMAVAITALLVFAVPAMAWTPEECDSWYDQYGKSHEDCKPPETTPPPTTEVPPPPVVEVPPVVPPVVVPPVTEVTTTPETPTVPESTVQQETPDTPKEIAAKGKNKPTPNNSDTLAAAEFQTRQVSTAQAGQLPYTGLPAGLLALAGASMLAAGYTLRRRMVR